MRRLSFLVRRYGLDHLVALAAIEGVLELVLRGDAVRSATTPQWLAATAVVVVVLPLLARRQFPFAAPAAVWRLGSAFSFVDGWLIVSTFGVYRIIQEGLTNSLKHAGASNADVTLRYRPQELALEVLDEGTGAGARDGLGHGLVGIRERVKIYGGDTNAATAPTGGLLLSARLPVDRMRA